MLKVCHITSAHNSQDVRILKKQCTSLAKARYETYLVAQGDSYIEHGVNVIGIGDIKGGRLMRMTKTAKAVYKKALELDCDVYQLHDPELLRFAIKLKKQGKKVIFDSHENYYLQIQQKKYIPAFLRKLVANKYRCMQERVLNDIDAVLFPCLKNGYNIFKDQCKRAIIIGNQPLLSELYDQYDRNMRKQKNTVCHVGGLTYSRGIKHLAISCHKANAQLILAGKINDNFKKELLNMHETTCIDFRGDCSREQVREIYQNAVIGCCTILNIGQYNIYDNFATKVYEYMAMGLPVILSNYPYAKKVNDKYNFAILVDPENTDEIANAITYLLDNPDIAKQMGENGRRAVLEEFNWDVEEKKLLKLYEELSQ